MLHVLATVAADNKRREISFFIFYYLAADECVMRKIYGYGWLL